MYKNDILTPMTLWESFHHSHVNGLFCLSSQMSPGRSPHDEQLFHLDLCSNVTDFKKAIPE